MSLDQFAANSFNWEKLYTTFSSVTSYDIR